jgi:acyl-CoA synthetase (AMP-forming)/AMP-acid ligase II
LGLGRHSRIGVALANRPEHLVSAVGVLATERTLVVLSPLQPPERFAADLGRAAVPALIAAPGVVAAARAASPALPVGAALELHPDGRLTHPHGADVPPRQAGGDGVAGVAIEMLTSGTTGPPKRVSLTDEQLDGSLRSAGMQARAADERGGVLGTGLNLVATPLVHIGGLWNALATLFSGRKVVLLDRFTVETWTAAVATHRPRASGLVPAAMRSVLDADVPAEALSSLQVVLVGTTACPPELMEEFTRRYGVAVLMTYGATEFAGAVAGWTLPLHSEWWARKRGAAGRAFPGVRLRVVDESGVPAPEGETGVLEVGATQSADGDGRWVRTSDLARVDGDGFLWIEGRADDAIARGGFKVQPGTVAAALERHPAVAEAAVAGLPDSRLGSVPVAAVELRPDHAVPPVDELIALCRQHLLPYEVPTRVRVVEALPRTPSSKVSREGLLELFTAPSSEEREAS